jgi:FAD/FMN-containing dehydrogenase
MPVTIERRDPRYEVLKKGRNLRFPATDAEAVGQIVICSDAEEIAEALRRTVSSGLRPTVRSGGHCYEDFVVNNPNGVLIDLSTCNHIEAGPSSYAIAPGAMLGEVYQALYKRSGVTIPAGTCYTVGAGGHISGGGYGVLSRLYGLTVDWVTQIDILTVDGNGEVRTRHVDGRHDPDLFRACRGAGGGNFGIITAFRFDTLPRAPIELASTSVSFPWSTMTESRFAKILTRFGDYWQGRGKDPDSWGLFSALELGPRSPDDHISIGALFCNPDGTAKDLSVLHEFLGHFADLDPERSTRSAQHSGHHAFRARAQGKGQLRPAQAYGFYEVETQPWIETAADPDSGRAMRAKYKSAYMKETFHPAECRAIYKYLTSPDAGSRGTTLAVDSYGGALNNPDRASDTAIAQRSSVMKLQWQSYWTEPSEDPSHLRFLDEFFTAVYTGDYVPAQYQGTPMGPRYEGCYMNYADCDMLRYSFWPELFYGNGDLYPFLQKVKQRYDPHNIFHSAMSIRT